MTVKIERFDAAKKYNHINKFDCDNSIVNKFVHNSLKAQVKAGTSVAWALVDTANQNSFVGFYTLMMSQVSQQLLANIYSQSLPYRVPCVRLVMLGVDIKYKHNGYGKRLMKHALLETKKAADMIGCRGIYLDSDPNAVSFYTGLGFALLETPVDPKSPIPMFLFKESFF